MSEPKITLPRVTLPEREEIDIRKIVRKVSSSDIEAYVRKQFIGEPDTPLTLDRYLCQLESIKHELINLGYVITL